MVESDPLVVLLQLDCLRANFENLLQKASDNENNENKEDQDETSDPSDSEKGEQGRRDHTDGQSNGERRVPEESFDLKTENIEKKYFLFL